jgi:hypothetical protein
LPVAALSLQGSIGARKDGKGKRHVVQGTLFRNVGATRETIREVRAHQMRGATLNTRPLSRV